VLIRHLETSEATQPDFDAMIASNRVMASMLATADDAAAGVIEGVLADEPCVITHGSPGCDALRNTRAAEFARDPRGVGRDECKWTRIGVEAEASLCACG
jgi:hypothetical protein